ncbi:hypothetical protein GCM10010431_72980 [Streptomyces kunmingensis]
MCGIQTGGALHAGCGAFGCPADGGQEQQYVCGGSGGLAARGVFDGGVQALEALCDVGGQDLTQFQQG